MTVDVALFGATGFAGRLTAEHLSKRLPDGASWAIAGRNKEKLANVAADLANAGGVAPQVIVADHTDAASMADLAASTRVLISTVGPYLEYGEPAVKAAVEAGIGYVDLTGEPQFVDQMWLTYQQRAIETGAKIIHACGFDSIPYDLGVLQAVEHLPEGVPLHVELYVRVGAEFSGGTFHSGVAQISRMRESGEIAKKRRRAESRPEGRRIGGGGKPGRAPALIGGWRLPLPLIDPIIVLRSAKALERYGPDFSYEHYANLKTLRMTVGAPIALACVALAAQLKPTRNLLLKLKDPGDGPSEAKRAKSWFNVTILGEGGGRRVRTIVKGGDPGYTETAIMLGESALCLAFDDVPDVSGQLTPAVAMGSLLTARLVDNGITFETQNLAGA